MAKDPPVESAQEDEAKSNCTNTSLSGLKLSEIGKEELEDRANRISTLQSERRKAQVRLEEIHFSWKRVFIVWGGLSLVYLVVALSQYLLDYLPEKFVGGNS